jgi:regulator of protease activity HflC (stomatin/prohibitin superfamily)
VPAVRQKFHLSSCQNFRSRLFIINPFGSFAIDVPTGAAVIIRNRLTRRLHVLGPGRHIKFPWEVAVDGLVRLEVTSHSMDIHATTTDGMNLIYRVSVEYRPQLTLLPLYLRTTAREIKDKIETVVHKIIEAEVSARWSTELYEGTSRLEQLLKACFASDNGQYGATIASGLGIRVEKVAMAEPTLSHRTAMRSLLAEIGDDNVSHSLSDVLTALDQLRYDK